MSRIGKLPIAIPDKCQVTLGDQIITVKGPHGELTQEIHPDITVKVLENEVICERPSDHKTHRALHGLVRSLINNMLIGVTAGFEKKLEVSGVGWKAESDLKNLTLHVGYSHPVVMEIPIGLTVKAEKTNISISGISKHQVGQFAAHVRAKRPPEPYKGHGIKYSTEHIRRKAGKRGV